MEKIKRIIGNMAVKAVHFLKRKWLATNNTKIETDNAPPDTNDSLTAEEIIVKAESAASHM